MKIRFLSFSLLTLSPLLFFCGGCDGSSDAQKPAQQRSPSGKQTEKSDWQPPSFRKEEKAPEKNKTDGAEKKDERKNDSGSGGEKRENGESSGKEKGGGQGGSASSGNGRGGGQGGSSSSGNGQGGGSASGGQGNGTGGGTGGQGGGSASGGQGNGTGGGSFSGGSDRETGGSFSGGNHHRGGSRRTAPPDWTSSEVKQAPSATDSEIWASIISCAEKLIVGSEIRFSPLGAKHTSLTTLSQAEKKYKAAGRCLVVDKNGNEFAYEFECIARANQYEAIILSVKFTER